MNKRLWITAVAAGLLCTAVLASCGDKDRPLAEGGTEAGGSSGTEAVTDGVSSMPGGSEIPETVPDPGTGETPTDGAEETTVPSPAESATIPPAGTESATEPATETETAMPRYDYMAHDVADRVKLDRADYTDLHFTLPDSMRITDADVAQYVRHICFENRTPDGKLEKLTKQAMKAGDSAFIYFKGLLDGKEFEGGSNWEAGKPSELGLGSGEFIPGFEEGLIGVIPAHTSREKPVQIPLTFPEDYHKADMAGKEVVFLVYVEYSVAYTIPDYNRDFVLNTLKYEPKKDFYASDRALLDEFEAFVREKMEADLQESLKEEKNHLLWDHLLESSVCTNLPEEERLFYFSSVRNEIDYYYGMYGQYGGEEFTKLYPTVGDFAVVYLGLEKGADWEAEIRRIADELVCQDLILFAVAERENLKTVTDEEYKAKIQEMVDFYQGQMTAEEIEKNMGQNLIRMLTVHDKTVSFLEKQASYDFAPDEPAGK